MKCENIYIGMRVKVLEQKLQAISDVLKGDVK